MSNRASIKPPSVEKHLHAHTHTQRYNKSTDMHKPNPYKSTKS